MGIVSNQNTYFANEIRTKCDELYKSLSSENFMMATHKSVTQGCINVKGMPSDITFARNIHQRETK